MNASSKRSHFSAWHKPEKEKKEKSRIALKRIIVQHRSGMWAIHVPAIALNLLLLVQRHPSFLFMLYYDTNTI